MGKDRSLFYRGMSILAAGSLVLYGCQPSNNPSSCNLPDQLPNLKGGETLSPNWKEWDNKNLLTFKTSNGLLFGFARNEGDIQRFFGMDDGTPLTKTLDTTILDGQTLSIDMSATNADSLQTIIFGKLVVHRCGSQMFTDSVLAPGVTPVEPKGDSNQG